MGGMGSGRYSNAKRAKINEAVRNQPSLFGDEPILPYKLADNEPGVLRCVQGETSKEKLKHIREKVYCQPTVSLEDYCSIIFEWLRINSQTYTVLDFFEDDSNQPFEYTLEEVMSCPAIAVLLEQRIGRDGMNGKLKGTLVSTLLANKYNWCTSKTETKSAVEVKTDEPIQFEFGD